MAGGDCGADGAAAAALAFCLPGAEAVGEPLALPEFDLPAAAEPKGCPLTEAGGAADMARLGQRRVDNFGCPHCDSCDVARWGRVSEMPRYRCKACRRTFNALTKTPLAGLRQKDKWATQAAVMIEGTSTAKAAALCGVHYTTALRWRHRFLTSLSGDKPKRESGTMVFVVNPFFLSF